MNIGHFMKELNNGDEVLVSVTRNLSYKTILVLRKVIVQKESCEFN